MPLTHVNLPASRLGLGRFGFPMKRPDGSAITVWVTDEALEDIESPPPHDEGGLITRLDQYRDELEKIASDRFDRGETAGPIEITTDDLDLAP